MAKHKRNISALAATLALLSFPLACGAETPRASGVMQHVAGEKLDSGLGELPHYREWARNSATRKLTTTDVATRVPGEKLDSGLGELPHYREWAHRAATRQLAARDVTIRVPGEKLDSGLGVMPHYRADRR